MSRGRDRGKGFTFSLEAIGLSKGDSLPAPSLVPLPLYPPLPVKPLPLRPQKGDNYQYLCDVKQDLVSSFRSSKYFLVPPKTKLSVQRYSDKFEESNEITPPDECSDWDWRIFPDEIRPKRKKTIKKENEVDVLKKLDLYALKEDELENNDEEEKEGSENASEGLENEVEEDVEEETDYGHSYFDNGENYLDDSDDNLDEGPTY